MSSRRVFNNKTTSSFQNVIISTWKFRIHLTKERLNEISTIVSERKQTNSWKLDFKPQSHTMAAARLKIKYPCYNTIDNNTGNNGIYYYSIIKYHNINICRAMKRSIFRLAFVISANAFLGDRAKFAILTHVTFDTLHLISESRVSSW